MILTGEQIAELSVPEMRARILQVDIAIDDAKQIEDWGTAAAYGREMEMLRARIRELEAAVNPAEKLPGKSEGPQIVDWVP
jgi:hypothetical protein